MEIDYSPLYKSSYKVFTRASCERLTDNAKKIDIPDIFKIAYFKNIAIQTYLKFYNFFFINWFFYNIYINREAVGVPFDVFFPYVLSLVGHHLQMSTVNLFGHINKRIGLYYLLASIATDSKDQALELATKTARKIEFYKNISLEQSAIMSYYTPELLFKRFIKKKNIICINFTIYIFYY